MANNEDILKEAEYYLDNDVTIEQASSDLGISKRTVQLHMKKLESIAPDKFKLVQDKKISNERQGKIKGGTLGKRTPFWSHDEAIVIAQRMVEENLTYEQAEKEFGIPKSTIHEMTHSGLENEKIESLLYALAVANKKGIPLNDFLKERNLEHLLIDKNEQPQNKDNKASKK